MIPNLKKKSRHKLSQLPKGLIKSGVGRDVKGISARDYN